MMLLARSRWLSKGKARLLLAIAGLFLAALLVLGLWRAIEFWGLPDVGDPFDVDEFGTVEIAENQNAYHLYRQAVERLVPWQTKRAGDAESLVVWDRGWQGTDPTVKEWLDKNQEALAIWFEGTTRPDAVYHQPKDLRYDTLLPIVQSFRDLDALARLQAVRKASDGDMAGAWAWHAATIRGALHVAQHGCLMERRVARAIRLKDNEAIIRWAADPRVDAALLRRAVNEVRSLDAAFPPPSRALKTEYMAHMNSLDDWEMIYELRPAPPPGNGMLSSPVVRKALMQAQVSLNGDRERSRRVLRLLFANWLSQCDLRAALRAPQASETPLIYRVGPHAPPAARRLTPEELSRRWSSTMIASEATGEFYANINQFFDDERSDRAELLDALMRELSRREQKAVSNTPRPSTEVH